MSYTVHVDYDLCESFGVCVAAAPKVFDLDDDDQLLLLDEKPGDQQAAAVRDAIARCPKKAISIVADVEATR